MIRLFDFLFSFLGLIVLLPILILLWIIGILESGSPLFKQERVGYNQKLFILFKFRTMHKDTKSVPTHRVNNLMVTKFGFFLRRTKLDELPQLWSILNGDMSFVGPRPALFNQYDLIKLRTSKGVHHLTPGLTGWAQVNGRDNLSIAKKVNFDAEYLKKKSFIFDLKILYLTVIKIIRREGIQH